MRWDDWESRRRIAGGIVALGLVLGVLGCASPSRQSGADTTPSDPATASPTPSPQPTGSRTLSPSETDTSLVADRILALAGPRFSGIVVHPAEGRIVAYWAGEIPSEAADYASTSPGGITVELNDDAPFTRSELKSAAERITQSEVGEQVGVSSVAVRSDGSGLGIDLVGDVPTPAKVEAIAAVAGLPENAIEYTPFNAAVPAPATKG